jgi:hypothetical protein
LGVGVLGLGPHPPFPNPQSPIPNPHFDKNFFNYIKNDNINKKQDKLIKYYK